MVARRGSLGGVGEGELPAGELPHPHQPRLSLFKATPVRQAVSSPMRERFGRGYGCGLMEVRFYHLQSSTVEQALPALLEKALQQEMRAVVLAGSEAAAAIAWIRICGPTARTASCRTARRRTGHAIGSADLADGEGRKPEPGQRAVFAGRAGMWMASKASSSPATSSTAPTRRPYAAARERWKAAKEQGHELTYWQQGERFDKGLLGHWEKNSHPEL